MNLTCIIIEDEPLAIKKLEGFLEKIPFVRLLASFDNALDGLAYLKQNKTDILFLDIEMEQLSGIQLLETLTEKPYVIITSAYANYALKGYELRVFDYLLKPYSFERLLSAVNRVSDEILQKQQNSNVELTNIFVKTEYRIENIPVTDILYVEGMQGYLRIVLSNRKIMTKLTFKGLLEQLPASKFIQVHKSWVVNIAKVEMIERNRIRIAEKFIPIGDSYRDGFYKAIGN
jgi:DNA-binding LytR/AlgR family response regulator